MYQNQVCTRVHICVALTHVFVGCRAEWVRYAFAAAVGKRHYTERMNTLGKSAIIEHHRSVQWAEKEYVVLATLLSERGDVVERELVKGFDVSNQLFNDYGGVLL